MGFIRNWLTKRPESEKPKTQSHLSMKLQNENRILIDCIKIINTSVDVGTVVGRYNLLIDTLMRLSQYEGHPSVSFEAGELPSKAHARMKEEKSTIMISAIQRAYDDMIKKSSLLKTDTGKSNRRTRFFDKLMEQSVDYPDEFTPEVITFIGDLMDN